MEPLRIALVQICGSWDFSGYLVEAAKLYGEGFVDKIYVLGGDFSRQYYAGKDCTHNGVPSEDVISDEPDLVSFVRECDRGVELILVVTSWMHYARDWYRFGRMPKWVWSQVKFRIASLC
jgi:hypothetical protein